MSERNLELMKLIDEQYRRTPFYGSRRMTAWLKRGGYEVNRKRVSRLMREMGLEAIMDWFSRYVLSWEILSVLDGRDIKISMDGRGRALDNVFVDRLWRSLKYEEVYLKDYESVIEAVEGIRRYFKFYNEERLHQSLGYKTPAEV